MLDRKMVEEALAKEYLSQSRVSSAAHCLYKYKLVEVDRLVRRWNPAPLRRGTLVHAGFEAALLWDWAARHLDAFGDEGPAVTVHLPDSHLFNMLVIGEEAIRAKQAEWMADERIKPWVDDFMKASADELVDAAVKVFRRSFAALGVHTGKWKTVAAPNGQPFIEYPMTVPFPGWAGFRGTLDWVAMDERGHVWLWDFKTRKALKSREYDALQIQAPCYQFLLKETLNVELVGTVTYQIRAAVRKRPKMNTRKTKQPNGTTALGMSRAAITTDWPTYRQALLDNGLDPDEYLDMKDKLPASMDRPELYYRGPRETAEVWNTVLDTVDMMEAAHRDGKFPRNINPFTCGGCSHRSYCEADLRDEDLEALEQSEYMREDDDGRYPAMLRFVEDEDDDDSDT